MRTASKPSDCGVRCRGSAPIPLPVTRVVVTFAFVSAWDYQSGTINNVVSHDQRWLG